MDREAWLAERRTGIGGSDAAPAAGLSKWKTPYQLWEEKVYAIDTPENEAMHRGTLLEPAIRQWYCDATGRSVATPGEILRNPSYPWALANLDGIDEDSDRLLECKTARDRRDWGEPGSDEIPLDYTCQTQHYMAVADMPVCDVAVLFGDFEFAIYTIHRDQEFIDLLMEAERNFWLAVQTRTAPHPVTHEDIKRRWPKSHGEAVSATVEHVRMAALLASIKHQAATLEAMQDAIEARLKLRIREADELVYGQETIATWRSIKAAKKFNVEAFKQKHPDLYAEFLADPAPQRRFNLKEKCECLAQIAAPQIPENLEHLLQLLPAQDSLPDPNATT